MKKSEFELLFDISNYYTKEIAKKVVRNMKLLKDESMLILPPKVKTTNLVN